MAESISIPALLRSTALRYADQKLQQRVERLEAVANQLRRHPEVLKQLPEVAQLLSDLDVA
ncbi:hypothetical protein [Pantanalinema sp. GBBB05]|uniref:hypothetical protein n=1 Tax=Pantanalinema sp. GBBB05 TaxID=2604139 RepID=UPI001D8A102F|nr:hypothetical protein [Pantanalinema sp. GBBB05]